MMARLLAEMKAETRTNREETRTNHAKTEAKIDACVEKTDAWLEEMKSSLGTTRARMESGHERIEAEIEPDVEEKNTTDFEANGEKSEAVLELPEGPKEEAAVEMIGATEDRTRDLAVPARRKDHSHKGPMVEKR
jgi:hypothetical protein